MTKNPIEDEFLSLISRNKGIVYKICRSYCRDAEKREDLAQEMLIQLWRSYEKYDSQQKFSTWMYRVSLNVAISFYRSESRKKINAIPISYEVIETVQVECEIDEEEKKVKILYQFIDGLDELNKALILLYLDDLSHKKISEILGITETNVGTKVNRIKKKLREFFSSEIDCDVGD